MHSPFLFCQLSHLWQVSIASTFPNTATLGQIKSPRLKAEQPASVLAVSIQQSALGKKSSPSPEPKFKSFRFHQQGGNLSAWPGLKETIKPDFNGMQTNQHLHESQELLRPHIHKRVINYSCLNTYCRAFTSTFMRKLCISTNICLCAQLV